MKFFHLSDLHIGKMLNMHDLSDIQRDVFRQIIEAAKNEHPDAILIAGDIYNKAAPSGDSFDLFDEFLVELSKIEPAICVMIISGNHDSPQRLDYAASFLEQHRIYISASLPSNENEHLKKVILSDEFGEVDFVMLPFTRPLDARNLFGEECEIKSYDEAVAAMLEREDIDFSRRNVLISHQFYVSSENEPRRCESETRYISVGGIDSVNTSHIEGFDYAALGHIHSSQKIGGEHIRYCGTPIKYSVSEADDEKSITVVELFEKGAEPVIGFIPLVMKHDVKKLRGKMDEIISMSDEKLRQDLVSITLTDESIILRPKDVLTDFYDRIIEVLVDNTRTGSVFSNDIDDDESIDVMTLFEEFYQEMNGQPISDEEKDIMVNILDGLSREGIDGAEGDSSLDFGGGA